MRLRIALMMAGAVDMREGAKKATAALVSISFFKHDAFREQFRGHRVRPTALSSPMLSLSRSLSAAIALAALLFAGCQNDSPRGPRAGSTGDAPMTASGELATPNPKPMDAQAAFFGSQIGIEVMLAKSDAVWKNANPAEGGEPGGRGRGGFSGGFGGTGGGGRRGGGGQRGGGGGGGPPQNAGDASSRPSGPPLRANNAPPVQLRLRLTNRSDQPLDVEVLDFNSELGNFAVQPAKITVPPHESVEADPMTSRLGVPAVEKIPLTVRLRVGGKSGRVEQQVLQLEPRAEPPVAPAAK